MRIRNLMLAVTFLAASLMMSIGTAEAARKQVKPLSEINVCVGGEGGNYEKVMSQLVQATVDSSKVRKIYDGNITVNIINTAGSREILDSVESGECDFGIAQYDAYLTMLKLGDISTSTKKISKLYPEWVHLLCGKESGVKSANDLGDGEIIALVPGSGAELTWTAMGMLDDDYKEVQVVEADDLDDAIGIVADNEAHCTLYVTGLGSGSMAEIDQNDGDIIKLAEFDDWDFNDAVSPKGDPMYEFGEIDSGVYDNLLGWGDADTIFVQASSFVNQDFYNDHKGVVKSFKKIVRRNKKWIAQATGN